MSFTDKEVGVYRQVLFSDWETNLVERFPTEFSVVIEGDHTKQISYGFNVRDGWKRLVQTLVIVVAKQNKVALEGRARFHDVSTFDGRLSVDIVNGDDRIKGAISAAVHLSEMICNVCGRPGAPRKGASRTSACHQHARDAEVDERSIINIFNRQVRDGVADQSLLIGLSAHDLAVEQCVLIIAHYVGSTRGLEAEEVGILPRLVDLAVKDDDRFRPLFEFCANERLIGFVEYCRAYVALQNTGSTALVPTPDESIVAVGWAQAIRNKLTAICLGEWLAIKATHKRYPVASSISIGLALVTLGLFVDALISRILH